MRVLLLSFVLILLSLPAGADAPPIPTGRWKFAGGEPEVAKMEAVVDGIVADMSFLIRPVARPKLKSVAAPWKQLQIKLDGELLTISHDDKSMSTTLGKSKKVDGTFVEYRSQGSTLVEIYTGEKGGRTNTYRLTTNGLRVDSEITSPRLPRPLKFTYTYR